MWSWTLRPATVAGQNKMEKVKTAVIGIGNMGTAHAQSLWDDSVPGLALAAVCDTDPARLAYAAKAWPGVACYASEDALLAAGGVQAAIVAVPHPLHSKIASLALAAGLHVLVEKPLDVRLSVAQALCAQAKASGKVFALMLNQRTNPLFAKARAIVQGGQLGQLKRSVWIITNWYRTQHYYDSGAWRATWAGEGGGVLLNQAPHNLDLWQWICGMPESVTGYRRWKAYCTANGLTPCSLYELRHTFVSVVKTLPAGEVKDLVGHSEDMDTFGVYAHTLAGDAENTARAVNGVFLRVLKNA